jgi:hypothetical protein
MSWLRPQCGLRPKEGGPIGTDPENGDPARGKSSDLSLQPTSSRHEFLSAQFFGLRRRSGDNIGEPVSPLQEQPILPGSQDAPGKARRVQGGPETIAWAGEVVADRR